MRTLRDLSRPQGDRAQGSLTLPPAVACLFPGQGSQMVGMGRALADEHAVARRTFAEADDCLGMALSRLCFAGPAEALELTANAQPAILTASVAAWRVLAETSGLVPCAVAGHSLGEWSALVAAGVMAFADAVRGVRERGRLMQEAVPVGAGAMAAVMGVSGDEIAGLCAEAAAGQVVTPANLNGGGQVVVAGHAPAVDRLMALAEARGARVVRLAVSAPFHCPLMAPAAAGLEQWLADVPVREPAFPVLTSVDARRLTGADEVKSLLVRQMTAPVRWEETVRALAAFRPAVILEVGPGRTLAALARRIVPDIRTVAAGDAGGIQRAREALG